MASRIVRPLAFSVGKDDRQRTVLACDVDGERWAGLAVHIRMFVSVALRVKPAAPDVNDAFRVAPAVKQPGQVPDGRVQGVERRIAFEYQNVEQAVVPLGEIGERQCAGRASVEDEEDDGLPRKSPPSEVMETPSYGNAAGRPIPLSSRLFCRGLFFHAVGVSGMTSVKRPQLKTFAK